MDGLYDIPGVDQGRDENKLQNPVSDWFQFHFLP